MSHKDTGLTIEQQQDYCNEDFYATSSHVRQPKKHETLMKCSRESKEDNRKRLQFKFSKSKSSKNFYFVIHYYKILYRYKFPFQALKMGSYQNIHSSSLPDLPCVKSYVIVNW